ncbi:MULTISPECIES: hypothetical protein [Methylorubrum]|nr:MULTISPECIES: hypothetical protein [Bacteria]MBL7405194.1 hypothetical protein [Escherichia coli]MDV2988266.1 hypothetical protein [Methylobacteriaceae bacterium AG10]MBL7589932.1 hypothetical protein [Escherichia coli]MCP1546706.1 uncharacterized small protein (DUF1192 family) [Methylorubrum extorquens]MCP1592045.1 uncharacterized small protein (DUF1192 family) [Methylorubrum extorquens]
MDAVSWLTYDELAERLGIERESARQHVKRKRWARRPGNDGKVRIGVPEESLSARSEPGTEGETVPVREPEQSQEQIPVPDPGVTAVLTRHIERLEAQLEEALSRASEHDAIATHRDILSTQLDALRAALDAAERDRDRWHEAATRVPEPATHQPWWRRLAG